MIDLSFVLLKETAVLAALLHYDPAQAVLSIGSRRERYAVRGSKGRAGRFSASPFGFTVRRERGNYCIAWNRKVTICARVQTFSGLKVVSLVPLVIFSATAQRTALV